MSSKTKITADEILNTVFSSTFELYFATHSYHWNIEGKNFYSYHKMLGDQYETLWESLDEIAEMLRTRGFKGPNKIPQITVSSDTDEKELILDLIKRHKSAIKLLKKLIEDSDDIDDTTLEATLSDILEEREKMLWMLTASAEISNKK